MKIKHIRQGLAVYRNDQSRFWFLRLWNPLTKKYVRKSTKETVKIDAISSAVEFADHYNLIHDAAVAARMINDTSFEHFARQLDKRLVDDWKRLNRPKDGLLAHFGNINVAEITTGMVRQYLVELDANREKPLALSTKKKHCFTINKVLSLAHEDGLLTHLPKMPKIKTKDNPRPAFNDSEYLVFFEAVDDLIQAETDREREAFMKECSNLFLFIHFSFMRPVESELFGFKWSDVNRSHDPDSLEIAIMGKTGNRTV